METTLDVRGVTRRYGTREVLKGITFAAQKGEIIALLGRNGTGKSTLMNTITGYLCQSGGNISICGYDVLTHAVEAYVSTYATEYTNGMCRDATKMVFDYLPRAYRSAFRDAKADPVAREKMANASAIAGIAFANAFLGINHSLSHKIGGWFHIPHGTANALLFPYVCRFNAQRHPYKMGTFSQYDHPHTLARYAEVADYLKLGGTTDEEKLENLIAAIDELKVKIGIKKTIRDYGIDETDFLTRLDSMVEQAFDDQCTGANPRYPLMSEIKQMYLNAYYGTSEAK